MEAESYQECNLNVNKPDLDSRKKTKYSKNFFLLLKFNI